MSVSPLVSGTGRPCSRAVSVIIPTRNRGSRVLQTLRAVLSGDVLPLELIVVDQSDPELAQATWQSMKQVASDFALPVSYRNGLQSVTEPGYLRYVRSHERGVGNGRNTGAALARGEILLFTDDDTLPDSRWVTITEQEYRSDSRVVGVYGRILPYVKEGGERLRSGTEVVREGMERIVYTRPTNPWHLGSGGNMSFRRDAFRAIGGFDEVLGAGAPLRSWEDLDIGHRLLTHGVGAIVYAPDSLVYHDSPKSFAAQLATERGYGIGAGAAFEKYRRCGDGYAWAIFRNWIWHMAVRRSAAGLLKWHNWQVVRLALAQFWYPLVGVARARQWSIDRRTCRFVATECSRNG